VTGAGLLFVDPPRFDVTLSTVEHGADSAARSSNVAMSHVHRNRLSDRIWTMLA